MGATEVIEELGVAPQIDANKELEEAKEALAGYGIDKEATNFDLEETGSIKGLCLMHIENDSYSFALVVEASANLVADYNYVNRVDDIEESTGLLDDIVRKTYNEHYTIANPENAEYAVSAEIYDLCELNNQAFEFHKYFDASILYNPHLSGIHLLVTSHDFDLNNPTEESNVAETFLDTVDEIFNSYPKHFDVPAAGVVKGLKHKLIELSVK